MNPPPQPSPRPASTSGMPGNKKKLSIPHADAERGEGAQTISAALIELNIDGLVGPTHNYSGLAPGNVASEDNAGAVSNPRAAALQGIAKMGKLASLGVPQMVMPPQPRPFLPLVRALGFADITAVAKAAPQLLAYIYSASGMWAANAATVAPSADAGDKKVHFTPANLINTAHRAIEPAFTFAALKRLFAAQQFVHHAPLPANLLLADEGAANHMRLAGGVHIFLYGREGANVMQHTAKYPARQGLEASRAVARLHALDAAKTFYVRQNPLAIDAGVFHNDVIATSHENLMLYHEDAFAEGDAWVKSLPAGIVAVKIPRSRVSLADAVKTYLFNCQIVSTREGMVMIAPVECEENAHVRGQIEELVASNSCPLSKVEYVNLRESMRNGGGPACLRLRVQLTEAEIAAVHQGAVFDAALQQKLTGWVEKHYRDRFTPKDLADPKLADEAMAAYRDIEGILNLKGLYDGYF